MSRSIRFRTESFSAGKVPADARVASTGLAESREQVRVAWLDGVVHAASANTRRRKARVQCSATPALSW